MKIRKLIAILTLATLTIPVYANKPTEYHNTSNIIEGGVLKTSKAKGSSDLSMKVGTYNPDTGEYEGTQISAVIPLVIPSTLDPNNIYEEAFTSPEFSLENTGNAPIRVGLRINQNGDNPTIVEPDKDERTNVEWQELTRTQSASEIALGIYEVESGLEEHELTPEFIDFWYLEEDGHDMNIIYPKEFRKFSLKSKHGMAFDSALVLEYDMTFIIELE